MTDRLTYNIGNTDSPTDPFGHEQISVCRSGTFTYKRSHSSQFFCQTGHADPEFIESLFLAMQKINHPDSSIPSFAPGDRIVTLSLEFKGTNKEFLIDLSAGLRLEHVKEVLAWGESWTAWLRRSEGPSPYGIQSSVKK